MRSDICITIDTEFSIGGAFTFPDRYVPLGEEVVRCEVNGRENGLGFLLESFQRYDVRATFFVEVLQTAYFGDVPMGRLVERIARAGHDIQMHAHPCWLQFRNRSWKFASTPPSDSCVGRSDAELDEMLEIGFYAFERWGLKRPVALRTGGFFCDNAVYRAMKRAGMELASNIGMGIEAPKDPDLQLCGGRHWIEGVLELPALSYRAHNFSHRMSSGWRLFSITGSSWPEARTVMLQAAEAGVSPVVLVTHPFEFVKRRDFRFGDLRANRLNQRRLLQILEFLKTHDDRFAVVTFGERKDAWRQEGRQEMTPIAVPMSLAIARAAHNTINDRIWLY